MPVDVSLVVAVAAIFFLAGTLKGVLGFGLPIIGMALLPFFIEVEQAVALSASLQPLTNLFQLLQTGPSKASIRVAMPVLFALPLGIVFGSVFLSGIDSKSLLLLVGATISLFALFELSNYGFKIAPKFRLGAGVGFGLVGGVFGVLTSLNGWAFVLYLIGCELDRERFRATIAVLFIASGFFISSSLWFVGWLNQQTLKLTAIALVFAFVGMWLGNLIGARIPNVTFRKLVLLALVGLGVIVAFQAF